MRKEPLATGYVYHVFTKSIAGYRVFRSKADCSRMQEMMEFYSYQNPPVKFSIYRSLKRKKKKAILEEKLRSSNRIVEILAYCIMPTHLHLVLAQLDDNGISLYMKNLLNSYTRYFNTRNSRKGPLWQGRFKSVLVKSDEQLLHLTRYIHLNPTSDGLVEKPEDWLYSSYREYLDYGGHRICNYSPYLKVSPDFYRRFVEERKDYQRSLSLIKELLLE